MNNLHHLMYDKFHSFSVAKLVVSKIKEKYWKLSMEGVKLFAESDF